MSAASSSAPARGAPCQAPIGARLSAGTATCRRLTLPNPPGANVALTRPGEPVARPVPPPPPAGPKAPRGRLYTRRGEPVARPLPPADRAALNATGRACGSPVAARSGITAELLRPGPNECHARVAFDTPDHRDWPPARRPARGPVEDPRALRPSGRSAG